MGVVEAGDGQRRRDAKAREHVECFEFVESDRGRPCLGQHRHDATLSKRRSMGCQSADVGIEEGEKPLDLVVDAGLDQVRQVLVRSDRGKKNAMVAAGKARRPRCIAGADDTTARWQGVAEIVRDVPALSDAGEEDVHVATGIPGLEEVLAKPSPPEC
jgi:hypothetical protein